MYKICIMEEGPNKIVEERVWEHHTKTERLRRRLRKRRQQSLLRGVSCRV